MTQRNSGDQQQPPSLVTTASQLFGQSSSVASTSASRSISSSLFGRSMTSTTSQGFGTSAAGGGLFGAGQIGVSHSLQNASPTATANQPKQAFGTGFGGFSQNSTPSPPATGFGQLSSGGSGSNLFAATPAAGFGVMPRPQGQGLFGEGGGNQGGFGQGFNQGAEQGAQGFGQAFTQGGFGQGFNQGGFGQGFGQSFNQSARIQQAKQKKKEVQALHSSARDPCTWLFLVNGGQQTFDEELKVREQFEKLYKVFVSNGVVKEENVVCATGTNGNMCGVGDTIVNACSIGKILTGTYICMCAATYK